MKKNPFSSKDRLHQTLAVATLIVIAAGIGAYSVEWTRTAITMVIVGGLAFMVVFASAISNSFLSLPEPDDARIEDDVDGNPEGPKTIH